MPSQARSRKFGTTQRSSLQKRMRDIGRKGPPHFSAVERFNTPIIVFLTVCTKDRKKVLANDNLHELLKKAWQTKPTWLVGRYMIMPNHLHLFCAPADCTPTALEKWVYFWKSKTAANWPTTNENSVWQRHFWDTQLRRGESYDEKWEYVVQNPVRAGLVRNSEDWPFQGELNVLPWL